MPTAQNSQKPRVLLITSDQVTRALGTPALENSGFRLSVATNAGEAMTLATESPPDVILLDLLVEDADALTLRKTLRRLPNASATPIFVVSDLFDPGLIATVYNDPFSEFLAKPINWLVLPHRLRQAVVVGRSVAELAQYQESLEKAENAARSASSEALKLRNFDDLTGLPNRATFAEIVALAVSQMHNRRGELAVLFVDIDQFKQFNESLGRDSGDAILRAVAGRLRSLLQKDPSATDSDGYGVRGSLARIDADEFAILLDQMEDKAHVERIANEVLSALMAPYSLTGRDVFLSASIGIALASESEGEAILQCAETAMRHAKNSGGRSVCVYDDAMKNEVIEKLEMRERLRRAIDRDELRLHYQPIVDTRTGRITGLEGLVRWTDPEQGDISPAIFIPIAEEGGLVVTIGDWVLREALKQLNSWIGAGLEPVRIALNVARAQLEEASFVEKIEALVVEAGIDPRYLELELSERGVLRDDPLTLEKLRRLQQFGVTLAIDDFGTGQTTLAYLQSFPLSVLKIDRSFVARIDDDPATETIIRAMVAMAHELDLRVVGEGVETEAQASVLSRLGCDEIQGFLFHRAMPAPAIQQHLSSQMAEPRDRLARRLEEKATAEADLEPGPKASWVEASDASHDELFRLAHNDFLTGLLNRYSFERSLGSTLARAQRFGHKVALLIFDLDQFKEINDAYGHSVGDELLIAVARRMERLVRQVDCLARLGGDEFAVIHSEFKSHDGVATLAQKLSDSIGRPIQLGPHELSITSSVGIAVYPPGDSNPKRLYDQADLALYKAKEEGRARFHFHEHEMDQQVQTKLQLGSDLARAVDNNELHLVFQPQFSLAAREIVAVEALVRWSHPKRGLIPPDVFIPVAEDTGEMIDIGEWVLREACSEARAWQTELGVEIPVSVNLSYVQFRLQSFPKEVERILEETGLEPRLLELELNQRVLLRFENDLEQLTRGLDAIGVSLCVDDFGTSPFSIEDLTHLPFHKLKVDGRHIRGTEDGCSPLVRAVIALGKKLSMGVVAEAVESRSQVSSLLDEGCDFGQGHFFTRPMTVKEVRARLGESGKAAKAEAARMLRFPENR